MEPGQENNENLAIIHQYEQRLRSCEGGYGFFMVQHMSVYGGMQNMPQRKLHLKRKLEERIESLKLALLDAKRDAGITDDRINRPTDSELSQRLRYERRDAKRRRRA